MKKRILIFSVAYHPFVGGAEVAVKEITDRLSHKASDGAVELEFEMITLNLDGLQKSEEQVGNVKVYRIGGKGRVYKLLFPFSAYVKARTLHKIHSYNAVWSIMASFGGFAASFFKRKNPHVPFILTLQEGDPIEYIQRQVRFVYPLFKNIFKRATIVQTISTYLATFAREMGVQGEIHVIPNGVDTILFTKTFSDSELEIVRQEIGKEPGERFLITTSRLVVKNGIKDVIAAMTLLPSSVKFIILGIGPLEQELRKQVEDLDLGKRVVFVGQKEYQDIPKYLAVSDIFIRPSRSEGMGNSFIEAMAAGIPVIATPVGGIPDFLKDRETGLFCNVQDPESVKETIELLLSDTMLREYIKTQAQAMVFEKYDWNTVVKAMQDKVFSKV
ncbi:glycosyltransferase family 4 protein [Patescibacteria group bacterium]|nr:glycosyltransferase family 4 protein [Patescibacteria group bacterium]